MVIWSLQVAIRGTVSLDSLQNAIEEREASS